MQRWVHPEQRRYYTAELARPGREGDFLTAPEAHPIFGWALARQVADGAKAKVRVAGSIPPLFGSYRPDLFDAARAPEIIGPLIAGLALLLFGQGPVRGFAVAGIGPRDVLSANQDAVGGRNYIHGFTASVALFD